MGLHGGDAGEDGEEVGVLGRGDLGEEEKFVHFVFWFVLVMERRGKRGGWVRGEGEKLDWTASFFFVNLLKERKGLETSFDESNDRADPHKTKRNEKNQI